MKSIQLENKYGETVTITVGDSVGFKCDVEQYGEVVEINKLRGYEGNGYELILTGNFSGGYIGGRTRTTVFAEDVWTD